ncbi:MAG: outer membrane protein transport protein [Candidatus Omnitrophota bacterium]
MKHMNTLILGVLWGLMICSPVLAAGSGAYRIEVPDAGVVGKGSAFAGEANTPSAVYYNPAGMTQMKGNNMAMGASVIQPKGSYKTSSDDNKTKMARDSYIIPHGYFVTDLGISKFALGLGAGSFWGLVTDWGQSSVLRYSTTRAEVRNQDYMLAAAYQVTDQVSLSLGVDIDDSSVDKQKKIAQGNPGVDDANFRLKGANTAAGFRVAGMYKYNERHQFGLMYRSAIEHKYTGKVHLDNLNDAGTTPYQTIFGGSSYETDVISKSTLPDSLVFGYSYKPTSKWTFNADVEWMNWSVVNEEELAFPSETNATRQAVLNNGNPASRDWRSVFSAALGAQYAVSDRFRVRGGMYHHQSPIPGDNWEPNLPDAPCNGITTGFGYDLRKDLSFDLAWSGIYYSENCNHKCDRKNLKELHRSAKTVTL